MGFIQIAKIATKIGIASAVVYYSNGYGIWGNMKETEEGYARLKSDIRSNEYCKQLSNMSEQYVGDSESIKRKVEELRGYRFIRYDIMSKFPELPRSSQVGRNWNKAVEATFSFLSNSPSILRNYAVQAQEFAGAQLKEAGSAQALPISKPVSKKDNEDSADGK